ncbi:uncharacterized protein SAPINGB_P002136 [Magnusiomyces paraingens]|uniref:Brix domain-containing protein n=1 Tax=Magnusiomyces paraingens TaxID=2606893 RepID=A0A5E8BI07_9ASCO|nr:uncharacterized protein SAPINGB_P002136 [Saprochaete ingens]VVT49167.1 unnamed protein product [Saprochaete ingens]
MSAIYKSLSKGSSSNNDESNNTNSSEFKNRQRVLIICSRGTTFRHRHLVNDLASMMPHGRKEAKFDHKSQLQELNEVAELYNCNNILYFEARKHLDLYMWLSKAPNGPSAKFHVQNMHTMDELNFTGNCLKGSRPILSFDKTFDTTPEYQLLKEMFLHTFGVPPKARKSKPFIDHVLTLSIVDNKIWFRNYQIAEKTPDTAADKRAAGEDETELSLVEIGPRFVLTLITILEGSFGGPVIYENKEYVSPNAVRAQLKAQDKAKAEARDSAALQRRVLQRENALAEDPLSQKAVFK